MGSPSLFGRKRPFISLNSSASIENLSSSERARVRARAYHAINDAQEGCAMQLNGITLRPRVCLAERKREVRGEMLRHQINKTKQKQHKVQKRRRQAKTTRE